MVAERQEWTAQAEPTEIPRLRRAVVDFVARYDVAAGILDDVRLCVTEAATNAVLHAFRSRGGSGTVVVSADIEERELVVHVADDGSGFAPRPDSPGLGLGLSLIGRLTQSLTVSHRPGGGTDVRMGFDLGSPAGK